MELLGGIGFGAIGGAVMAGSGYLKNITKEDFDFGKAAITLVCGAVVGGFMASQSESFNLGEYDTVAFSGMVTYLVQNFYKVVPGIAYALISKVK